LHLVLPEITFELVDITDNRTHPVEFLCQAVGEPIPNIRWYFNGVMVNVADTSKYSTFSTPLGAAVISFLVVFNAQSSDVGTYTCEAQNIVGTDQSFGILTVNGMYVCAYA